MCCQQFNRDVSVCSMQFVKDKGFDKCRKYLNHPIQSSRGLKIKGLLSIPTHGWLRSALLFSKPAHKFHFYHSEAGCTVCFKIYLCRCIKGTCKQQFEPCHGTGQFYTVRVKMVETLKEDRKWFTYFYTKHGAYYMFLGTCPTMNLHQPLKYCGAFHGSASNERVCNHRPTRTITGDTIKLWESD